MKTYSRSRTTLGALFLLSALILVTGGCGGKEQDVQTTAARPVKVITVGHTDVGRELEFPAVIRARESIELAFNVPGQVMEIPVIEGQPVEEGVLLARLDNREFKSRLDAAQAALELAERDFERFSGLSDSGAVPLAELDRKRAALQAARSELELARKSFEDTILTAPFDGVVSRRLVQRFGNVQAKEPVLVFQSIRPLDVVIHVPEPMVIKANYDRDNPPGAMVSFDGLPGVDLPVQFREVSTEADPETQTFAVAFTLEDTTGYTILPGMSAILKARQMGADASPDFQLPPLAVLTEPGGERFVYVYNPESGTVERRNVEVGRLGDEGLEITSGLSWGEQVVSAGVSRLSPGMAVRPQNP
jgi:RND family efflux transporter MFP subunit